MAEQSPSTQPAGAVNPEPAKPERRRIDSIDLLRGIVMVIMMLDHTRDFVHAALSSRSSARRPDDNDDRGFLHALDHTFLRARFCLSRRHGSVSATGRAGRARDELSKFLLTRGLWLIVLEVTVVRFGVFFSLDYRFLGFLQVIWVIGVSMIILAALIHLPLKVIAGFGVAMIVLHNLLDRFQVAGWNGPGTPIPSVWAKLWILLHQPFAAFPILPVMSPGDCRRLQHYSVGRSDGGRLCLRKCLQDGCRAPETLAFDYWWDGHRALPTPASNKSLRRSVAMVFAEESGFHHPFFSEHDQVSAFASFPVDDAGSGDARACVVRIGQQIFWGRLRKPLVTFGRVPLFFYLLQWYTAHLIGYRPRLACRATGCVAMGIASHQDLRIHRLTGIGFPIWVVYLCWIVGVLLLYPVVQVVRRCKSAPARLVAVVSVTFSFQF